MRKLYFHKVTSTQCAYSAHVLYPADVTDFQQSKPSS